MRAARWLRQPLVHFVLIGALAWWLSNGASSPLAGPRITPDERIVIDAARLAEIEAGWRAATGREPSEARRRVLIEEATVQEVLVREALHLGLDRTAVVRQRLSDLGRFLELAEAGDEAEQAARALGLERSDPIVRRYMAEAMTERLRRQHRGAPADDAAIDERLAAQPERYATPNRLRVSHVFVAGHDPDAHARALRLLDEMNAQHASRDAADREGDAFYGGGHFPMWTERQLAATLGEAAAAKAAALEVARWSDPVASPYGWHLLWVEGRNTAEATEADARRRIAREIEAERSDARLASALTSLRAPYAVVLDPLRRGP